MQTFQLTATVNEQGNIIIPAPLEKAGARLRLVVAWEEGSSSHATIPGSNEWKDAILQFKGIWENRLDTTIDVSSNHKRDIW